MRGYTDVELPGWREEHSSHSGQEMGWALGHYPTNTVKFSQVFFMILHTNFRNSFIYTETAKVLELTLVMNITALSL